MSISMGFEWMRSIYYVCFFFLSSGFVLYASDNTRFVNTTTTISTIY